MNEFESFAISVSDGAPVNTGIYAWGIGIAAIVLIVGIIWAILHDVLSRKNAGALTTTHVLTIVCSLVTFTLFRPISIEELGCGDFWEWFRSFLSAAHSTLRAFILDCDFSSMLESVAHLPERLAFCYSIAMSAVYVAAPVLTFANVLVLFKNVINEFRANWVVLFRPVYIMSELNERSVAVASSINEKHKKNRKWYLFLFWGITRPFFVFTDVFGKAEESHYELVLEARKFRGVLVKKDISRINLKNKFRRVEVFLIGDNESENVTQAIHLTNKYKNKSNFAIFVYASSEGSGHIIDSLEKGTKLVSKKILKQISKDPCGILNGDYDSLFEKNGIGTRDTFYIKRIDPIEMLVTDMLSHEERGLASKIMEKSAVTGVISLTIVGMGLYGKQILKTAVWFFQKLGYKLEINVFDDTARSFEEIGQECPEFLSVNPSDRIGDACYDIKFFSGINCFSSAFDECFEGEYKERLKRTQAVFVTLGNDDMNIEASIMIRKLFDRVKGINKNTFKQAKKNASLTEDPIIYSVVYDDKKSEMLESASENKFRNYKDEDYKICFVGKLSDQYSYATIERIIDIENRAIAYHLEWARLEAKLREFYNSDEAFKNFYEKNGGKNEWNDGYFYYSKTDEEGNEVPDYDGKAKPDVIRDEILKFFKFEYFRHSSMAKALHKKVMNPKPEGHSLICDCKECDTCRISEHMRWNAYMRSVGYINGSVRADRAKVHTDIVLWDELFISEKYKD